MAQAVRFYEVLDAVMRASTQEAIDRRNREILQQRRDDKAVRAAREIESNNNW